MAFSKWNNVKLLQLMSYSGVLFITDVVVSPLSVELLQLRMAMRAVQTIGMNMPVTAHPARRELNIM